MRLAVITAGIALAISGCSSTSQSVDSTPATQQAAQATLTIDQNSVNDPGNDPKVYTPFYAFGQKYTPNATITLNFYDGNVSKGKVIASTTTGSNAAGDISALVQPSLYSFVSGNQYTAVTLDAGRQVAQKTFKSLGVPASSPTKSMFGFTSMCRPTETTGQFRISNDYAVAVEYTLRPYQNDKPALSGFMPPTTGMTYDQWKQFFVAVPWSDANQTWILEIKGVGTIGPKAIGKNPICT